MNPLVTLLLATAATGADPQPVVQQTAAPVASYTYTDAAPDSRPGFLGRIRNALGSKSSEAPPATYTATPVPATPSRRFMPSDSSPEPPLADTVPVTTPAPPVEVRPAPPAVARPTTPPPVVTQPVYTYPAPVTTPAPESSRARMFPRLRKLFGSSSSQSTQALPENVIATPQVVAPPVTTPATPVNPAQPQRMPIGNP
jgi:hypothetical protein